MKKRDDLQVSIEKALRDLLAGKGGDEAQKKELRQNVLLAIKWQAVKLKMDQDDWGSAFNNRDDKDETEELDDEPN